MSSPSRACSRIAFVEALRDGRLPESERQSLELHLHECADCATEDRALGALAERLRTETAGVPEPAMLRRLRKKALAKPAAPSRSHGWMFGAAAAAVVVLAAWRLAPKPADPGAPSSPPPPATRVDTTDEGGARWSSSDEGALRRIDLLEGALALRIDRPPGGHRVVVRVPDGEIEDVGTEFHVEVADGHTNAVRVDHGSVVLRLEGSKPHTLHAGESWARKVAPAAPPPPPPPSTTTAAPPPVVLAPAPIASASATVDEGEEDRAYVEIVRLLREDRPAEARVAARQYLQRYPNGFRRAEVQRVLAR